MALQSAACLYMLANVCGYSGTWDFLGKGCGRGEMGSGSAWLTVDYIYVVAIGKYTRVWVCVRDIKSDLEMHAKSERERERAGVIQFRLTLARFSIFPRFN